jgi:ribonuclease BN (tRNA processing enzyme)
LSITLTVLGSSGMYGTPQRACSGYLLEAGESLLWMDAGSGSWRNLMRQIDFRQITGILLSHRHPDHTSDVFQAFHARQYGGSEPLPPIPLWAPGETLETLCAYGTELAQSFDLRAVSAGESFGAGSANVEAFEMAHPVETLGMRVSHDGSVLAYSADTGPGGDLYALAHDADVFLCEATLQDSDEPWSGHLRASDSGRAAAEVGARRLLLTHLPPARDLDQSLAQARGSSGGVPVELAQDDRRLQVARVSAA